MKATFGNPKYYQTCPSLVRLRHADGERRQHRLVQAGAGPREGEGSCSRKPATTASRSSSCRPPNIAFMNNSAQLIAGWLQQVGVNAELAADGLGRRGHAPRQSRSRPTRAAGTSSSPGGGGYRIQPTRMLDRRMAANGKKGWFGWPTERRSRETARPMGRRRRRCRSAQGDRRARCRRSPGTSCRTVISASGHSRAAMRKNVTGFIANAGDHPVLERDEDRDREFLMGGLHRPTALAADHAGA